MCLTADATVLYLASPVIGEHCIYRWVIPPEGEKTGLDTEEVMETGMGAESGAEAASKMETRLGIGKELENAKAVAAGQKLGAGKVEGGAEVKEGGAGGGTGEQATHFTPDDGGAHAAPDAAPPAASDAETIPPHRRQRMVGSAPRP